VVAPALGRAAQPFHGTVERLAIDWLRAASQQAVADQLGLTWDEVHGIMERAVRRGLTRRKTEMIGYLGWMRNRSARAQVRAVVNDLARGVCCTCGGSQAVEPGWLWPTLTKSRRIGLPE